MIAAQALGLQQDHSEFTRNVLNKTNMFLDDNDPKSAICYIMQEASNKVDNDPNADNKDVFPLYQKLMAILTDHYDNLDRETQQKSTAYLVKGSQILKW